MERRLQAAAGAERIAAAHDGQSHRPNLSLVSARSESKRTIRDFRR
jgi:hypothetical protein